MKKYILLCLLFAFAPLAVAQNVNRSTVMPGFFVPDNALKTTTAPENLQVNSAAQYRGKPVAEIYEMQTVEVYEEANPQPLQPTNTAQNKPQNTADTAVGPMPQGPMQNNETAEPRGYSSYGEPYVGEGGEAEEIVAESGFFVSEEQASPYSDIKSEADKIREALKHMSVEEYMQQLAKGDSDDNSSVYEQIFSEYKQDIERISRNKPVINSRLENMLADYRDEDRHL